MLVDGLGHELLAEHRAQAPYLHSLLGEGPATCGVPSTTATSLTSLGTALTPGQHGLVGFTSRVPETGELLNSLFWDQPVDPLEWQPNATAFARLEAVGVHTSVVSKREFAELRADPERPAWRGVRRGRRHRRAHRRCARRGGAAAVADLRLRRRPGLARPPRRGGLRALADAAARHRRGRAGAARGAARRGAPAGRRRPRDGRLLQGEPHRHRRDPAAARRRDPGGWRGPVPARLLPRRCRRGGGRDLAGDAGRAGDRADPRGGDRARLVRPGGPQRPAAARRRRGRGPRLRGR